MCFGSGYIGSEFWAQQVSQVQMSFKDNFTFNTSGYFVRRNGIICAILEAVILRNNHVKLF